MGLCLFFLPNFPAATFIQGATFIPDSGVFAPLLFQRLESDALPLADMNLFTLDFMPMAHQITHE